MLRRDLLVSLLLMAACRPGDKTDAKESATAAGPPLSPAEPGIVARFGGGSCYGACPTYTVALYDDGRVLFDGREYTITEGKAEGRVAPDLIEKVRAAFHRADFFVAEAPEGRTASGSKRTGESSEFVYYAEGGKGRRIDLPEGCEGTPVGKELLDLRRELHELLQTEKWIGTPEERKKFGSGHAH